MTPTTRTVVEILAFFIAWVFGWILIAWPLIVKYQWRPFQQTPTNQKLLLLLPLYAIAPGIIALANYLSGQTWQDQGIIFELKSVGLFCIGWGSAIAGLFLLLFAKQKSQLICFNSEPTADWTPGEIAQKGLVVLGLGVLGVWIGGTEEWIFRGWLHTQLTLIGSPWGAAMVGSFGFAIAHLIWEDRAGLWQQPGLWLLGMVLVAARGVADGNIALAWGLHAGWVSGLAYIGEFIHPHPNAAKPAWLAGRKDQPLTDALDLALMLFTIGAIGVGFRLFAP